MLTKKALKSGKQVSVTFYTHSLPEADAVFLVGDFNDWNEQSDKMEKLKDGRFKLTLKLDAGREYQFRYLVGGKEWHNDWEADKYVPNPFSGDNSVVSV